MAAARGRHRSQPPHREKTYRLIARKNHMR
jgi:hypothetical protein